MYQQNLSGIAAQCEQIARQLINSTNQSTQVYQQMLHNEQQNMNELDRIMQRERQAVQSIQNTLREHDRAVQQMNHVVDLCRQMQQAGSLLSPQQNALQSGQIGQSYTPSSIGQSSFGAMGTQFGGFAPQFGTQFGSAGASFGATSSIGQSQFGEQPAPLAPILQSISGGIASREIQ
ncbi:hypothetical protein GE107_19940 [Cohnella sp. CFH 77786]|uniref:hypothetical protein n=1 Tax=Cohnella sp. CFH 77786 TaxID=2662265 RepID=UPI001C60CD9E|nr:hypothetical protein [Cohnella sp. CFH 77786]MBW5448318.1 hypothetical protein [Cohnella sp. CFH 77786]